MHLSMVLHELATNARKYGALSVPEGRLAMTWEMRTNGGRQVALEWKESDGPQVQRPEGVRLRQHADRADDAAHGGKASRSL